MFNKFSTGNFYLREQGTGNREEGRGSREQGMGNGEWGTHRNNKIQSPPLTRGGLGWGQIIVDTLIMT
jgi:hypothetical protein